ncbi:hypothetical protein APHAL10511_002424 [Amanita phalloides]|nr:hypothetical protein APHAL10511_002424 [Amanita phalloides]
MSIDLYPLAELVAEELVVFVVSTTGSGQEPRSMTPFWDMLLRSDLPNDLFEDMIFTIFGLGDSAYEKFCWPAKKLHRRLLTLGAIELCEKGEGDDQHQLGLDGALIPWIDTFLAALLDRFPFPLDAAILPASLIPPSRITLVRSDVRPNENQTLPQNLPRMVTIRELLTRYVDFNAVPRRTFFQYLRYFITDEREAEKLDEFLSPEGADELYDYCFRVKRTIREIVSDFYHVSIPMDYIFDVFPPLRPRQYSIASSIKEHPRQLHLCIAVVKYKTRLKIPRQGVCTSYMSNLRPGDQVIMGLQKGFFRLPPHEDVPVICIGPGTGVAPMRSLIEERIHKGSTSNVLYFGCRSSTKDQHYESEWRAYARLQKMTYRTAFSRDVPEGTKRIYVQDLIQQDAEEIWKMVGQAGAWIYISGSSNQMPTAVKSAIKSAVERFGGYSSEDAVKYVESMIQEGRLLEECWS